jgi:hypothetical protein
MNTASDVLTNPVHKKMWQVHPNKSNIHLVDPKVFSEFKDKLEEVKGCRLRPFPWHYHQLLIFTHSAPQNSIRRAFKALDRLEKDFGAWRDFVEAARGLQRNLLEFFCLHGLVAQHATRR